MHKNESSFGIIPLRRYKEGWQVLLVKHGKGHWAFPKGHPEIGEEPKDTAMREFAEETGLQVDAFLDVPPQQERYVFRAGDTLIDKTVVYFAAEVSGAIALQAAEISDFSWRSLEDAQELMTFPEGKRLCATMINYLEG